MLIFTVAPESHHQCRLRKIQTEAALVTQGLYSGLLGCLHAGRECDKITTCQEHWCITLWGGRLHKGLVCRAKIEQEILRCSGTGSGCRSIQYSSGQSNTCLFSRSIWQVAECPQTVLDQTLAWTCKVLAQSLHPTWTRMWKYSYRLYKHLCISICTHVQWCEHTSLHYGWLVAGTHRQYFENTTSGP